MIRNNPAFSIWYIWFNDQFLSNYAIHISYKGHIDSYRDKILVQNYLTPGVDFVDY